MNKERILKIYEEVFEENGDIKSCGREKCKELILEMTKVYSNVNFGNKETGFMHIENIKKYINLI